ncbi:hypothetical protein ACFTSF_09955 [Kribbella sp. NPDC056951]|uniref:hypothetical protein n=1 Tax=Kribbella sp. NPDC056951 TaxID=3345978 RepID=UPI00362903B6
MALSVGDFVANIGLNDTLFQDTLTQMRSKFDEAKTDIVNKAEEAGRKVAEALGKSKGPVVGAAAGIGVDAAVALGGGLLSLVGGPVMGLLATGLQAGLQAAIGFLTTKLQPAFDAVSNFITGTVVPAFQSLGQWIAANQTPLMIVGGIILAFFLPALIQLGIAAAVAAAATIAAFATMAAQAVVAAAQFVAQSAMMLVQWGLMGWTAVANAAKVVGAWIVMGTQALLQGARMAAAWLLAMGPIPLIIAAVVGLVALIIANWDTIVAWTKAAFQAIWDFLKMIWNAIVTGISAAIDGVLAAIGWLGQLPGKVAGWFGGVFSAAVGKLGELLSWLGGLPGRILGALGNLGNLLLDVGRSILEGLWNGLKAAATWIKDKIIGLIKDIIPGPIKSILGISSPSKVAAELGRWVPLGLAKGIEDTSAAVARASSQLAGLVTAGIGDLSLATATPYQLASNAASTAEPERAVIRIENFYTTPDQTPADIAHELDWMSRGGG